MVLPGLWGVAAILALVVWLGPGCQDGQEAGVCDDLALNVGVCLELSPSERIEAVVACESVLEEAESLGPLCAEPLEAEIECIASASCSALLDGQACIEERRSVPALCPDLW